MTESSPNPIESIALLGASSLELEKNHLQFLGYNCTVESENQILAEATKSAGENSLWWHFYKMRRGVLALRWWVVPNGPSELDMLKLVNEMNTTNFFVCASITSSEEGTHFLNIKSFLEGDYDRSNFGIFVNQINAEVTGCVTNHYSINRMWCRVFGNQ